MKTARYAMKCTLSLSLLAVLVISGCVAAVEPLATVPVLAPNASDFPDASLVDCGDLNSPPAQSRGFMFVGSDGHFYFEDGTRARFWGINVAKDSVFQPQWVIDRAIEAIARAGFNLVRLHHIDDENGLLPAVLADSDDRLRVERLNAVDYWIAELGKRGIHVYLDLLDFRRFRAEEGVVNGESLGRGAKPYAVFDERLIELQKQYAGKLLVEHRNPYTGLSYSEDPTVCMIELCDENGLFASQDELSDMIEPYRGRLRHLWRGWLDAHSGEAKAGLDADGKLGGSGHVGGAELPALSTAGEASDHLETLQRRFFADVHRRYFQCMIRFLRSQGVQCPITAVTKPAVCADLWASAQELDFIAGNYYYNHPYFRSGTEWQLPAFFFDTSPLQAPAAKAFSVIAARLKVAGKPLVLREWNVCWPTKSTAAGMLQTAAYSCLQDIDGLILFTLKTAPGGRKLGYFDVRHDPTRWGLAPVCGRMFLKRQLSPARDTIDIELCPYDVFEAGERPVTCEVYERARISGMRGVLADERVERALPEPPGRASFVSDTGQIALDENSGILRINARLVCGVAGRLDRQQAVQCGPLRVETNASTGACIMQSLDGDAIAQSRNWLLKYVTRAGNTGQRVDVHLEREREAILALREPGRAPVTTYGKATVRPTRVSLDGRELISAYMANGAFELCRRGNRLYLYCDTPGVRIDLHRQRGKVGRLRDIRGNKIGSVRVDRPFTWPKNAAVAEMALDGNVRQE